MKAFSKRNLFSSIVSITLSVAFVASVTFASTTISTNIVTNGSLQVDTTSTLTGAVTTAGAVTLGDAAADAIIVTGNASTTNALTVGSNLYVGGRATTTASSGNFQMIGGLTVGDATANSLAGTILFSAQSSDPTGVTQGTIYYNSTDKVIKLFDGTNWFTTGTTTSGISLSGARLQLATLATQYMALGTTSVLTSSIMTLEATSTDTVPLTIAAKASQTADLLGIRNSDNAKLLYITSAGALFGSSTGQFTGALTTYGGVTLGDAASDAITITGNASTTNALTVGSNLFVGGNATTTLAGAVSIQGKFSVGTTTTPTSEISADGTATTTIGAFSSTSLVGGCIQLKGTNGVSYRMYLNGAANTEEATTTPSGKVGFIAIWEAGSCK